jgi:lipoate-protein ligase A
MTPTARPKAERGRVPLRVLLDAPAEGAWNMAVDEALLAAAAPPTLRIYGFEPHTVSLGYFQSLGDFRDLPPGTPLVRRLTGGGAIHHGDELTFALAVDAELLPPDVAASYRLLHDAAIAALADAGIASRRHDAGAAAGARPAQRWCFAGPGNDDVVTRCGKLLGSAQRRVRSPQPRVLHHGSIVLRRPALTPFVAAVEDDAHDVDRVAARLRQQLAARIAQVLGLDAAPGTLSEPERGLATRLRARYLDPGFLGRR